MSRRSSTRWKRVGRKAGPANVLDGRYRVDGGGHDWRVYDLEEQRTIVGGLWSMRAAQLEAEGIADGTSTRG